MKNKDKTDYEVIVHQGDEDIVIANNLTWRDALKVMTSEREKYRYTTESVSITVKKMPKYEKE